LKRELDPRARFELATLWLTAGVDKNLSALSGVAYKKLGAIFPFLVALNPAPNTGAFPYHAAISVKQRGLAAAPRGEAARCWKPQRPRCRRDKGGDLFRHLYGRVHDVLL
jgi:hypothetical protein